MVTIKKIANNSVINLDSLDDTALLGRKIASVIQPSMTLLLHGDLGAGKTTLVREICRALGWKRTCSPSFALVNEYAGARIPIVHADLYRLDSADGRDFGFDDYLDDGWALIIEWPERLVGGDFPDLWRCDIETLGSGRRVTVHAQGAKALKALEQLEMELS